jgi:hypothetical protein
MRNRRYTLAAAGALGLGLIATASFAGPLMLGPAPMPAIHVAPTVTTTTVKTQLLSSYRQIRTFWLSKAIVR